MLATFVLDITTDPFARRAVLRLSVAGGPLVAAHEVDLAQQPPAFWQGLFNARRHVRSLEGIIAPGASLSELGRFLGQRVLGPEIARALANGVDSRTLLIRLPAAPVDRLAAAFARVPWELACAPGDDRTLMSRNVIVRATLGGAEPGREMSILIGPNEPVRVLLVFADAPGHRPLAARLERERLLDLFFEDVMPARNVEVDVLCHGVTRRRLAAQVQARGGYHIVHWSGCVQANALEIASDEDEASAPQMSGEELVRLLASSGGSIPSMVFLGGCHSSSVVTRKDWESLPASLGEDSGIGQAAEPTLDRVLDEQPGFTETALALVRAGVKQVVATRYGVGDTYARRLARRFYKRMLRGPEHPSVDAALVWARAELGRDNGRAGEYEAVDHVSALVFGDPPLRIEPNAKRSAQIYRRAPKPQPLLPNGSKELDPPRWFVGRDEQLGALARRWLPPIRPYQGEAEPPDITVGIWRQTVDGRTGRMDSNGGALDEHGNPLMAPLQTAGGMTIDGELALEHANYLCSMGQEIGLVLPEGQSLFEAGQVFFEEGYPVEVRLRLRWRDTGTSWRRWTRTRTRDGMENEHGPRFILETDGSPERLVLDEADRDRCHMTAVAAGSAGRVVLVFDLRENARAADDRVQERKDRRAQQDNLTAPNNENASPDAASATDQSKTVAAEQEGATVAVIQGPTGAGKTWLAAEAIHLWFGLFDYVLCVQANHGSLPLEDFYRQVDQTLLLASEAYRKRCQSDDAAGIRMGPSSPPSGGEQEAALQDKLIDELARERILLVIDNVDGNLLPAAVPNRLTSQDPAWDRLFEALGHRLHRTDSRVIITSRHKLAALANSRNVLWIPLDPVLLAEARLQLAAQWPGWAWLYDTLQGAGLTLTSTKELTITDRPSPWVILAAPSAQLQQHFELQPEVLLLCAPVDIQAADVDFVEKLFSDNLRIDPGFALVITADPNADGRLAPVLPVNRRYLFVHAEALHKAPDPQGFLVTMLRDGLGRRRLFDFRLPAGEWQFFGREKELEALERDVLSGHSIGVFGLRKVGKTSLLDRLIDKLREGRSGAQRGIPVKVDLQTISYLRRNLDGIAERIGGALDRELIRAHIQVPEYPSHPLERLRAAVEHIEGTMGARVLLILDEYEVLLAGRIPIHDGIELLTWLRGLAQEHREGFGLVLIGRNQQLLAPARFHGVDNPMYRFLRSVHLAGLVPDDCRHMVQKLGGRLGLRFEPDALDIFVEETGGHPNLARTLGDLVDVQIPTSERAPAVIDAAMTRRILPRFSRAVDEDMRELVNAASDFDVRASDYLVHLAHGVPWIGGSPEARINDGLIAYGILHPETHAFRIGRLLEWLRENYASPAQVAHG